MNNLAKQPNRRRFQAEIDAKRLPTELNEAYVTFYVTIFFINSYPSLAILKNN